MGEKTSIRGGTAGEEREERKRKAGHNVPKTLVVHLLLNKVGQGQESERAEREEIR